MQIKGPNAYHPIGEKKVHGSPFLGSGVECPRFLQGQSKSMSNSIVEVLSLRVFVNEKK